MVVVGRGRQLQLRLRYCNPAAVTRTPSAETLLSAPLRGSTTLRSAQNDTADGVGFPVIHTETENDWVAYVFEKN